MFNPDSDLYRFVQTLSEQDPKSLSQKGLKMTEEVGELAKRILPYEGAAGTTHRFIRKVDILEEVADTFLVGLSIVHDLGLTLTDLEELMARKALKWDGIQKREAKVKFPCPFEIHITIAAATPEDFQLACRELGVKPLLIDAQTRSGQSIFQDLQTSGVHIGTNRSAYDEMGRVSQGLHDRGFRVVREKIETVPWHPAAPVDKTMAMPPNCYFESHIAVVITPEERGKVQAITEMWHAHLSRNAFKVIDGGNIKLMITYRQPDMHYGLFIFAVEGLQLALRDAGIAYEKPVIEFSIYDSKVSHDASWVKS